MSTISNKLKDAIKSSGLSQRELALKTGIPHSAIQRYASGTTERIPIGRIKVLAGALGTTAEHLLGWDEETSDTNTDDGRLSEFTELFQMLTPEQQALIISSIKGILSDI